MGHFLLVPEKGAARRLRRIIAEAGGAFGIYVGTWPELIEQLRVTHLVPPPSIEWDEAFHNALTAMIGAPWFESYKVAPIETAHAVSRTLREVIEAAFGEHDAIDANTILQASKKLDGRAALHLGGLAELWQRLGNALPEDIRVAVNILDNAAELKIEDVRVVVSAANLRLTPLQRRLIDTLAPNANDARAPDLRGFLKRLEEPACSNKASALSHISTHLFSERKTDVIASDESFQMLAARDAREEAEIAASMAQALLRANPGLSCADIGVLLPSNDAYGVAVRDAFALAGKLPSMRTRRRVRRGRTAAVS